MPAPVCPPVSRPDQDCSSDAFWSAPPSELDGQAMRIRECRPPHRRWLPGQDGRIAETTSFSAVHRSDEPCADHRQAVDNRNVGPVIDKRSFLFLPISTPGR